MEYFRKFLIFLRQKDNSDMKPDFITRLALVSIASILLGFFVDFLFPFNFVLNGLRGFIVHLTGLSLFSFSYLASLRYSKYKLKNDRYYQKVRKRFSYRQRMNISVVLGSIAGLFVFLSTGENLAFTITSSLFVFMVLVLVAFSRRYRDEFLKDVYEIPDVRDLEFMTKKNSKNKKEEEK